MTHQRVKQVGPPTHLKLKKKPFKKIKFNRKSFFRKLNFG